MNLSFLSGKSELAGLMRQKDWSHSSLGPPAEWPQSLKTIVGVMLANRFPMYIVWGPDFVQLYNDAYLPILGNERHPQALGEKSKIIWPEIWSTIGPMYQQVYDTGETIGFDDFFLPRNRNGVLQDAWYSFSYNPIRDESGKVAGIVVVCEETTERILSIKKLKEHIAREEEARARFEVIFQGSAAPLVFFHGPDHFYKLFNKKYQELIPGREIQDRPLLEVLPELKGTAYPKLISEVYQTGITALITEEYAPLLNKETGVLEDRYFDSSISRIKEMDGSLGVLVQAIEVTERVHSRKLLEDANTEIDEILESMSDGFFVVDKNWIIQKVNAQFEKIVGSKREDVIGKSLIELYFGTPELKKSLYYTHYNKAMQERVAGSFVDYYEALNIWTAVNVYPTPKGGLAVFFREISEEKKAAKKLQDAVAARDTFLSIASHELLTPITSMKLQTQVMDRLLTKTPEKIKTEQVQKLVKFSLTGLVRMNRLVEDMLDISRIQSGKLALDLRRIEFLSMIRDIVERFSEQLEAAGINLTIHSDKPQYEFNFDAFRMEQVFTNLITNAIKYAPDGPVTIDLKTSGPTLEITFKDSGKGISEADQDRIFDRFERVVPASEVSGLGLGLYIVREVIEGHKGSIHVESSPGSGAAFIIRLPLN